MPQGLNLPISFPRDVRDFFAAHYCTHLERLENAPTSVSAENILDGTGLPYLELPIHVPNAEIATECRSLDRYLVQFEPRKASHYVGMDRPVYELRDDAKGWKAVCLHGIESHAVGHHSNYGYDEGLPVAAVPHNWTTAAQHCPKTVEWIQNNIPMRDFHRIRVMVLDPQSAIFPHAGKCNEKGKPEFGPINIAITNPPGFHFLIEDFGCIPFEPGKAFWFAPGFRHSLVNLSDEPRYHIIVEGVVTDELKTLAVEAYQKWAISRKTLHCLP